MQSCLIILLILLSPESERWTYRSTFILSLRATKILNSYENRESKVFCFILDIIWERWRLRVDPWLRLHLLVLSELVISNTKVVWGAWILHSASWRHLCWMWHWKTKTKRKEKGSLWVWGFSHLYSPTGFTCPTSTCALLRRQTFDFLRIEFFKVPLLFCQEV